MKMASLHETLFNMNPTGPLAIARDVKLSTYNTWQVGGVAEFFCLPKTVDEVIQAQKWAEAQHCPVHVLSGGSNVLVADEGLPGLTICLKNLVGTEISESDGKFRITALAGTGKSELLKIFLKAKLAPALFLAGIPGDVGGGVVMNAGVAEQFKPREFTEITEWIDVLKPNGTIRRYEHRDVRWNYRHCDGWQPGIIVRVGIVCPNEPDPQILTLVRDANKIRLQKQPLDMPSCGSVFRNPEGHKAAQLIDQAGLKGFQVGQAQVSPKHANFIVNLGGAKARDILNVIQHVRRVVKDEKKVELRTEVVLLGSWSDIQEVNNDEH